MPSVYQLGEVGLSMVYAVCCHATLIFAVTHLCNILIFLLLLSFFTFTYPLTAGVVGAPRMTSQPVSSIFFSVLHCPLGVGERHACPCPDVFFPPLFPVCLVFFPLSLYLARWFGPDLMNGSHVHTISVCVSLRWSGALRVVRLPTGSWHRLPRW